MAETGSLDYYYVFIYLLRSKEEKKLKKMKERIERTKKKEWEKVGAQKHHVKTTSTTMVEDNIDGELSMESHFVHAISIQ